MLKGELFNTDMVRTLLDGRKLHTARPVKKKYDNTHFEYRTDKYGTEFVEMQNDVEGETFGKNPDGTTWRKLRGYIVPNPKFQPGDHMYVRETWAQIGEQYVVTKVEVMNLSDVDEQFAREDGFEADEMGSALDKFIRLWFDTYGVDAKWMRVYWMEKCDKEEAWNE